jgi:hypothetical protein
MDLLQQNENKIEIEDHDYFNDFDLKTFQEAMCLDKEVEDNSDISQMRDESLERSDLGSQQLHMYHFESKRREKESDLLEAHQFGFPTVEDYNIAKIERKYIQLITRQFLPNIVLLTQLFELSKNYYLSSTIMASNGKLTFYKIEEKHSSQEYLHPSEILAFVKDQRLYSIRYQPIHSLFPYCDNVQIFKETQLLEQELRKHSRSLIIPAFSFRQISYMTPIQQYLSFIFRASDIALISGTHPDIEEFSDNSTFKLFQEELCQSALTQKNNSPNNKRKANRPNKKRKAPRKK